MSKIDLSKLNTEMNNPHTRDIDSLSTKRMLEKINKADQEVALVVNENLDDISRLTDAVYETLKNGGRLIYIGAGTSGRLGVLDAAELPPTFGTDPDLVVGLIAGGQSAMFKAKEGAEDSKEEAHKDLKALDLSNKDMVIGLAASGRTPYVIGGLEYANEVGADTGSITCVEDSLVSKVAKNPVEVVTGPEVVTGSTRMKAGTAQKLVLNMMSTGVMIKLGKVYQNYMVDVKPTNEKLYQRAINMIMTLTDYDFDKAKEVFEASGQNVKTALVMVQTGFDKDQATKALIEADGKIFKALENNKEN